MTGFRPGRPAATALALSAIVLIAEVNATPAGAQNLFGSFFGQPRHTRTRRPPVSPANPDVPLPVPRPAFPGDSPPATQASPAPAPAPAAAPSAPAPPEPPPRPTSLEPPKVVPTPSTSPTTPPPAPTPPAPATTAPAKPAVLPSGAAAGPAPRQPTDDASCPARLKTANVAAEPIAIGPQPDDRCTIVEPVRLSGLTLPGGGKIDFPDHPTIACVTAETFAHYVGDLLSPLAKGTYGLPIATVWTGPGFECRSRDHIFGAKLSAHGQGLAVDIAQLKLTDGRTIAVGDPKTPEDQAFETAARAGACGYFHTVLGPGSDSYHRTHWHFDLELRGKEGDSKYCK